MQTGYYRLEQSAYITQVNEYQTNQTNFISFIYLRQTETPKPNQSTERYKIIEMLQMVCWIMKPKHILEWMYCGCGLVWWVMSVVGGFVGVATDGYDQSPEHIPHCVVLRLWTTAWGRLKQVR